MSKMSDAAMDEQDKQHKETLSDKMKVEDEIIAEEIQKFYYEQEDVKEFIKEFEEYMNKKFLQEKETHKNHRVQALLLDLRSELAERAGDKLNGTD